jgi:hypothetical protein
MSDSDSSRSKFIGRTLFQTAQHVVAKGAELHSQLLRDSSGRCKQLDRSPTSSESIFLTGLKYGNGRLKVWLLKCGFITSDLYIYIYMCVCGGGIS